MGILDDVVINAKTAAEAVGKKAGQIVDVSKLRFNKMAEIDELVNQRNILTKELVDKQNKVVCPSCGKQSPITASYCSSCGAKLTPDEEKAE